MRRPAGHSMKPPGAVEHQVQAHHSVEKVGGLCLGKVQVNGAQPGQRQLWIFAGGDDHVHLRRQVFGNLFADEGGLAKAGGGRNEDQFVAEAHIQPLDQAGPEDDLRPRGM